MSYRDAVKGIYALITTVEPGIEPDHTFHHLEADGWSVPVDEVPDDVMRLFDLRMVTPPIDDGASGYVYTRFRVGMALRVRYSMRARAMAEAMIGDDVARLVNALVHPSGWHESIQTIPPPGDPSLEELLNEQGVPFALMLTLPFTIIYHHSQGA